MADDQREWHWMDPLIEVYMKDVDQTIIDENLKLTPGQRIANLQSMLESAERVREAMRRSETAETVDDNDEL
jgi:hypothetical protein